MRTDSLDDDWNALQQILTERDQLDGVRCVVHEVPTGAPRLGEGSVPTWLAAELLRITTTEHGEVQMFVTIGARANGSLTQLPSAAVLTGMNPKNAPVRDHVHIRQIHIWRGQPWLKDLTGFLDNLRGGNHHPPHSAEAR
jgi:hypothetical protein